MFNQTEKLILENRKFDAPLSTTRRCGRGRLLMVNGLFLIVGEFLFLGGIPKMFESS